MKRLRQVGAIAPSATGNKLTTGTLTAVDLFAGAGGLSFAFHQAGFTVSAAVERNEDAAKTYQNSFIGRHSAVTKLLNCDVRDYRVASSLLSLGHKIDVVIGGPPCQDFSRATSDEKRTGKRANLLSAYLKLIDLLRPSYFVLENVPNLKRHADGIYWNSIDTWCKKNDYFLTASVLRAEDFGVPQRRHRLVVVGSRTTKFRFPLPTAARMTTVDEAIGHLPKLSAGEESDDPMHYARSHRENIVKYLRSIPAGGAWRDADRVLDCHKDHNGHYDVYGRIHGNKIAPTITGGCTNPSKGRFIHPYQHRGLTVREAALLQTFPSDWYFHGGIESQSLQVGNAVPVALGSVLANSVKRQFNDFAAAS